MSDGNQTKSKTGFVVGIAASVIAALIGFWLIGPNGLLNKPKPNLTKVTEAISRIQKEGEGSSRLPYVDAAGTSFLRPRCYERKLILRVGKNGAHSVTTSAVLLTTVPSHINIGEGVLS